MRMLELVQSNVRAEEYVEDFRNLRQATKFRYPYLLQEACVDPKIIRAVIMDLADQEMEAKIAALG